MFLYDQFFDRYNIEKYLFYIHLQLLSQTKADFLKPEQNI